VGTPPRLPLWIRRPAPTEAAVRTAGERKIARGVVGEISPDSDALVLRDGRVATVRPLAFEDEAGVAALLATNGAARSGFYALAKAHRSLDAGTRGTACEFVARVSGEDTVAGYAAYIADDGGGGELAGEVASRFAGVGLGTRLLRVAAHHAQLAGLQTLRVELHPGSDSTAAMLRDVGLSSHWKIAYPVTQVELSLGTTRPGWSTPGGAANE
jgi:GNAT superfamily N-acetyltransferase